MAGYIGSKASVVSSGAERKKTFTITGATTSLTGLNYTVGKVHVFQNGVRLVDGTDYTATNGTTITLTVAAQSGDNVVVISQASFQVADALLTSGGTLTGDLTVQGAFTSQGIDDNGNATALTIDSSENVMVGTTDSNPTSSAVNVAGQSFSTTGGVRSTVASNAAATFNRKTDDGGVVLFRKDGTTVGSIGSNGTASWIACPAGSGAGLRFDGADNRIVPTEGDGTNRNAAVDLGYSSSRFKDAYLSGGVYLGGTGSANLLDSYEEGTWTPTSSSGTISAAHANYVKVGRLVTIAGNVYSFSDRTTSGAVGIAGLPFASSSASRTAGSVMLRNTDNTTINASYITASSSVVEFYGVTSGAFDVLQYNDLNNSSSELYFTISYYTDS